MKRVIVTGAAGHLGRKLFDWLDRSDEYQVRGLDLQPSSHPDIHEADLTVDGDWIDLLNDIDTIVHFAGDREPSATWDSAIRNNMDATLSLYHHAVTMGVKRVVIASSNWLHGGRRFDTSRLTTELTPYPVNAYGMSKLFCERTGAYFAQRHGLSVICMRIGWTQWTHDNKPGSHMAMGRWGQEMWLSDRDFLNGMQCAIDANNIDFAILNLMSDNPDMRWHIEPTKRLLGFNPQDGHVADMTIAIRLRAVMVKLLTRTIPDSMTRSFPHW